MTIFLLCIIICLLAHLDYQFFKGITEPRLSHQKMDFKAMLEVYDQIQKEKTNKNNPAY